MRMYVCVYVYHVPLPLGRSWLCFWLRPCWLDAAPRSLQCGTQLYWFRCMKKATLEPILINKLTFTLSLDGRRFHWFCFIALFMVASGWHSFFIKPHLYPVGNNHTQHVVNHHKIRREYVMLQNYFRILKTKETSRTLR